MRDCLLAFFRDASRVEANAVVAAGLMADVKSRLSNARRHAMPERADSLRRSRSFLPGCQAQPPTG